MRLFFSPELGVRVEGVAGTLPGVPQPLQLASEGVVGDRPAGAAGQVLPEQRDGPLGGEVAHLLGRAAQEFAEQVPVRRGQQAGPPGPVAGGEGVWDVVTAVGRDPVVDGSECDPETAGDGGDGFPLGDLQDRQGTAVHAGVAGGAELPFQVPPLPVGQGQGVHSRPPLRGRLPRPAIL
jgi:hypothetical protein